MTRIPEKKNKSYKNRAASALSVLILLMQAMTEMQVTYCNFYKVWTHLVCPAGSAKSYDGKKVAARDGFRLSQFLICKETNII